MKKLGIIALFLASSTMYGAAEDQRFRHLDIEDQCVIHSLDAILTQKEIQVLGQANPYIGKILDNLQHAKSAFQANLHELGIQYLRTAKSLPGNMVKVTIPNKGNFLITCIIALAGMGIDPFSDPLLQKP